MLDDPARIPQKLQECRGCYKKVNMVLTDVIVMKIVGSYEMQQFSLPIYTDRKHRATSL